MLDLREGDVEFAYYGGKRMGRRRRFPTPSSWAARKPKLSRHGVKFRLGTRRRNARDFFHRLDVYDRNRWMRRRPWQSCRPA